MLTGTALVHLDYGATVRGEDGVGTALPQKQTEHAALAIAADVLTGLG